MFQILIVFLMIGGLLLNIRKEIPENPLADVNEIKEWFFIGAGKLKIDTL